MIPDVEKPHTIEKPLMEKHYTYIQSKTSRNNNSQVDATKGDEGWMKDKLHVVVLGTEHPSLGPRPNQPQHGSLLVSYFRALY